MASHAIAHAEYRYIFDTPHTEVTGILLSMKRLAQPDLDPIE
jgi:hypothetical protein